MPTPPRLSKATTGAEEEAATTVRLPVMVLIRVVTVFNFAGSIEVCASTVTLPLMIATLSFKLSANSRVASELMVRLPVNTLLDANKSAKSCSTPSRASLMLSTSSPVAILSICDSKLATAALMSANPSASAASTASPNEL